MKNNCFIILILIVLNSCSSKQNLKREVYLGFELGSSMSEINVKVKKEVASNLITMLTDQVPYIKQVALDKNYYATPIFELPQNDSLVSSIKILYFDNFDVDDVGASLKVLNEYKHSPMNLRFEDPYRINPKLIRDHVTNQLKSKYGEFDKRDTTTTDLGYQLVTTFWKNRNDVDIVLKYQVDFIERPRSSIILEYSYTPEFYKKVFSERSIY